MLQHHSSSFHLEWRDNIYTFVVVVFMGFLFACFPSYYCITVWEGERCYQSQVLPWQTAGRADNLNNMYLIHSTSSPAEIKSKVNKSEHWFLPIKEQDSAEFPFFYLPIVDGNYNSLVREKQELMGIKVI